MKQLLEGLIAPISSMTEERKAIPAVRQGFYTANESHPQGDERRQPSGTWTQFKAGQLVDVTAGKGKGQRVPVLYLDNRDKYVCVLLNNGDEQKKEEKSLQPVEP